jgi:hypothetical protein
MPESAFTLWELKYLPGYFEFPYVDAKLEVQIINPNDEGEQKRFY